MDIIAHIKAKGMTVSATARMAGVSRPTLYVLGNPEHKPELETVVAVARVLGLSPADIRPELAA